MKKIFAGLMSLAMVLGLAVGGASASTGSGTFTVTSDFSTTSPEVYVSLLSDSYTWGVSTYVQQKVEANPDSTGNYGYDVQMVSERYINNAWTVVSGSERTVSVSNGQSLIVNQLIAANGVYKAKGLYRIKYTFIEYGPQGMLFDYGTSRQFNIN